MEKESVAKNPSAGQAKEFMGRLQQPSIDISKFQAGEINLEMDFQEIWSDCCSRCGCICIAKQSRTIQHTLRQRI